METQVLYNSDLHFEHMQWRRELAFWEDELKSFTNRLEELVKRKTDKILLAQLEHYQNQFIIHGDVIEKLQEKILAHEINMGGHSIKGEDVLNQSLVRNHIEIRNKMEIQRNIYGNLKKEFFGFLSKYM